MDMKTTLQRLREHKLRGGANETASRLRFDILLGLENQRLEHPHATDEGLEAVDHVQVGSLQDGDIDEFFDEIDRARRKMAVGSYRVQSVYEEDYAFEPFSAPVLPDQTMLHPIYSDLQRISSKRRRWERMKNKLRNQSAAKTGTMIVSPIKTGHRRHRRPFVVSGALEKESHQSLGESLKREIRRQHRELSKNGGSRSGRLVMPVVSNFERRVRSEMKQLRRKNFERVFADADEVVRTRLS